MAGARYDAVASFYEDGFSDPADPVLQALLALLGPPAGRRVLDVACGHGRVSRELARQGAAVTGIDLSAALIAKAEAEEQSRPLGIRYLQGDASDRAAFSLAQGVAGEGGPAPFDAVVCNFGLADIDDLDGVLATVERALRPGGVFVFSILHPCFAGAPAVAGTWPAEGSYYDEGFWTPHNAASTLRRQVGANHRMLSTYVNALAAHGLLIAEMTEPDPPAAWSTDDRRAAARQPVFLVARCTKPA
jgi:2-polyprenyl-3-methyl-5-hydroxy-6-metoxy-1,4-benzoquinol methylase